MIPKYRFQYECLYSTGFLPLKTKMFQTEATNKLKLLPLREA